MTRPNRKLLRKLRDKEYRHEFLSASVRGGVAYQMQSLRRQDGSSQQRFSAKVGKTQTQISRLEDTEYPGCTVQTLIDVASALGVGLLIKFVSLDVMLRETEDSSDASFAVVPVDAMDLDGPDEAAAQPVVQYAYDFNMGNSFAADSVGTSEGDVLWLNNHRPLASMIYGRAEARNSEKFIQTTLTSDLLPSMSRSRSRRSKSAMTGT